MPLRNAPLPRMAGDLTFMRSRRSTLGDLNAENLAILGAPIEDNIGRKSGTRFAPTALRETSVYFGWHANPQFSHPVDIDARVPIDTSEMHDRLVDIGDIPLEGMPATIAAQAIRSTMHQLRDTNASAILLGGDDSIVCPAVAEASKDGPVGFIQIGGRLLGAMSAEKGDQRGDCSPLAYLLAEECIAPRTTAVLASTGRAGMEFLREFKGAGGQIWSASDVTQAEPGEIERAAQKFAEVAGSLHVHFDVSAFRPSLHGMSERPAFGGLTLPDLQKTLGEIGRAPVSSLIVTGLNPTLSGLSVVKTGLRLTVTALLAYIYGRLGLEAARRP
jgi:agmatinase